MAALNIAETEMLGDALKMISSVRQHLRRMADEPEAPAHLRNQKDLESFNDLADVLKKAYDNVHTVRTMKGHYHS